MRANVWSEFFGGVLMLESTIYGKGNMTTWSEIETEIKHPFLRVSGCKKRRE